MLSIVCIDEPKKLEAAQILVLRSPRRSDGWFTERSVNRLPGVPHARGDEPVVVGAVGKHTFAKLTWYISAPDILDSLAFDFACLYRRSSTQPLSVQPNRQGCG